MIAGVYANRLDPDRWATGLMEADPTVFYGLDTLRLEDTAFQDWPDYRFWAPPGGPLKAVELPARLASFQSYRQPGLPEAPIATPTAASIAAALAPDTDKGYLFFVLKNDGSRTHAFARTFAEHEENLRKLREAGSAAMEPPLEQPSGAPAPVGDLSPVAPKA